MATIILVDDEPHMRAILTANLQQDGHVVIEANGFVQAKNAITGNEYEVVITDHKMDTSGEHSPAQIVREKDSSRQRTWERCFWTKWPSYRLPHRPSFCGS